MSDKADFYLKSVKEVFEGLKTNEKGLYNLDITKKKAEPKPCLIKCLSNLKIYSTPPINTSQNLLSIILMIFYQ